MSAAPDPPAPPAGASGARAADAAARTIVARSRSSFRSGMRLLPPARRRAIHALYAFCRTVDDIADGPLDSARRLAALDGWRCEIDRLYAGRPSRPVTVALAPAVERFALPRTEFVAVLDGMAMDAREIMVAPPRALLELYCRRVAGAVGLLSVRIFGARHGTADPFALALGDALQVTNILRDIDEDAARGRLYLPRDLLDAAGVPDGCSAVAALAHPGLALACGRFAAVAEQRFAAADRALLSCDPGPLKPALVMRAVYRHVLDRLVARGWAAPRRPVRLGRLQRLWLGLRHGVLG